MKQIKLFFGLTVDPTEYVIILRGSTHEHPILGFDRDESGLPTVFTKTWSTSWFMIFHYCNAIVKKVKWEA